MGNISHNRLRKEYRWLLSEPSAWPAMDPAVLGLADPTAATPDDLLAISVHLNRGISYLTYQQYVQFEQLHRAEVLPLYDAPITTLTRYHPATVAFEACAAKIAATYGWGDKYAQAMLQYGVDLITRLPEVAQRLRDGTITPVGAHTIVDRTILIDEPGDAADSAVEAADTDPNDTAEAAPGTEIGPSPLDRVDRAIAAELDRGHGAWSRHMIRDMADRIVFREQPDAVRERRTAAKKERRVWTANLDDTMGVIGATMTAERIRVCFDAIRTLAARACPDDPRTTPQRNSDALFCLVNQVSYRCTCADPDTCTSDLPTDIDDPTVLLPQPARTILHVVADEATVGGSADNPGFLAGHGVISADHVRDIADDPTTSIRPVVAHPMPLADLLAWLARLESEAGAQHDVHSDSSDDRPQSAHATTESDIRPSATGRTAQRPAPAREPEPKPDDSAIETIEGDPEFAGEPDAAVRPAPEPEPTTHTPATVSPFTSSAVWHVAPGAILPAASQIFAPASQLADPYKPSAALDTYIRIRDLYSQFPGNQHSAFSCDLDHINEFDFTDPARGGRTEAANLGAKDRRAHIRKTHGSWTDDLLIDPDGRATPVFITPDGIVIEGRAGPGLDLFPGLARYHFLPRPPDLTPTTRRSTTPRGQQIRDATARKHARRRAERARNRAALANSAPNSMRTPHTTRDYAEDGDPPF